MKHDVYQSLENVPCTLSERCSLRLEVERYWDLEVPMMPHWYRGIKPFAGFARQVPSFRFEDAVFTQLAESIDLEPVWMGYLEDKFSTQSNTKRSYLQPKMVQRLDKHGQPIFRTEKWCDVNQWVGKRLHEIKSRDNCSVVDLHRSRLEIACPNARVYDDSHFMRSYSGPREYYEPFLSVFVSHGVLFEDYHGGESGDNLDSFTAEVFEPAIEKLRARFGVYPIVTPMPWEKHFSLYPDGEMLHNWRSSQLCNQ